MPLAAFLMVVVVGMVAFALDFGRMMVGANAAHAADAAAIAGDDLFPAAPRQPRPQR